MNDPFFQEVRCKHGVWTSQTQCIGCVNDELVELRSQLEQVKRLKEQWWATEDADTCREGDDATVARLAIRGCAAQLGNILAGVARIGAETTGDSNG